MRNKYQVYINAAKQIGEGLERYSCHAVSKASGKHTCLDYCKEKESYMRVFTETKDDIAFCREVEEAAKNDREKAKDLRILMLCMMAACYKDFR